MGTAAVYGPGTFEYSHGDVESVARGSGLGALALRPRLTVTDSEGNVAEGHEFVGAVQVAIESRGLPWEHLPFNLEVDNGESISLQTEQPWPTLERIRGVVTTHVESVLAVLRHDEPDFDAVQITLSGELDWKVDRADWDALVAWLNLPLNLSLSGAPISVERLALGSLDEDGYEYEPPAELEAAFGTLEADPDDGRDMVLRGLAHAILEGERTLQLTQSGEAYQLPIWTRG